MREILSCEKQTIWKLTNLFFFCFFFLSITLSIILIVILIVILICYFVVVVDVMQADSAGQREGQAVFAADGDGLFQVRPVQSRGVSGSPT